MPWRKEDHIQTIPTCEMTKRKDYTQTKKNHTQTPQKKHRFWNQDALFLAHEETWGLHVCRQYVVMVAVISV